MIAMAEGIRSGMTREQAIRLVTIAANNWFGAHPGTDGCEWQDIASALSEEFGDAATRADFCRAMEAPCDAEGEGRRYLCTGALELAIDKAMEIIKERHVVRLRKETPPPC